MAARRPLASALILLLVGFIGIMALAQRPRFQTYHNVDVLQLVASGMCFGMALSRMLVSRRSRG